MRGVDIDGHIDLRPGALAHRGELLGETLHLRRDLQPVAGAEVHLQAAKAPLLHQHPRRLRPHPHASSAF